MRSIAAPSELQLDWHEHDIGCMVTWNLFANCVAASHPDASALPCQTCRASASRARVVQPDAMGRHFPRSFNATAQVEAAASFGASYVLFAVNQMVGFALWPTKQNNYSISSTPFRGGGYDVVAEFVAACKLFGVRPAFFYSANRNNYNGVGAPIGPRVLSVAEQDAFIVAQLTELFLSPAYGTVFELWLDGGLGTEYTRTAAFLMTRGRKWLTHGFPKMNGIRWVGNEGGVQSQPNWGASWLNSDKGNVVRGRGDPYGDVYYPSSADCVLREHCWSWVPDMPPLTSTRGLVSKYIASSGQGSKLMLNLAPTDEGAVMASDVAAYKDFGHALRCLFAAPVTNHSFSAPMGPGSDGGWEQEWALDGLSGNFTLSLREDIAHGQRIWSWALLVAPPAPRPAAVTRRRGGAGGSEWVDVTANITAAFAQGRGMAQTIGAKRMFAGVQNLGGTAEVRRRWTRMKLVVHNVTNSSRAPALRSATVWDWEGQGGCYDG